VAAQTWPARSAPPHCTSGLLKGLPQNGLDQIWIKNIYYFEWIHKTNTRDSDDVTTWAAGSLLPGNSNRHLRDIRFHMWLIF
jgi:hypothetical protein